MDGLLVDAAPSSMRAERPQENGARAAKNGREGRGRAADRRRQRGEAPEPEAPRDTNLALQQRGHTEQPRSSRRADESAAAPRATARGARADAPTPGPTIGSHGALNCLRGPESGASLPLVPGSFTVGRARENDLVLKDIACSRKHIRIDVDGPVVRLVDLGSGNGTKVNGKRISEVELRHGDNIELGSSLLVFQEPGRDVAPEDVRGEAQARVVAAADELAKELSEKLRFSDGAEADADFVDGYGARTRALRTADARAVAEQIAREAEAQAPAARTPNETGSRRPADRLWNETFTNMPLSAVVPDDARLQGTARDLPDPRARRDRGPQPPPHDPRYDAPTPGPAPQALPAGPLGTVADASQSVLRELDPPPRMSFLTSVIVTAVAFIALGGLALGAWVLLSKDTTDEATAAAVIEKEKAAEYAAAMSRAQQAVVARDYVAVREYAIAALQVRPDDAIAATYKKDAEMKLAKQKAAAGEGTPPAADQAATEKVAAEKVAAEKVAADKRQAEKVAADKRQADQAAAEKVAAEKAAEKAAAEKAAAEKAAPAPRRTTRRRTSSPTSSSSSSSMSDGDAKARFERAIDAFRSKDDRTGCRLLNQVADRAPSESIWKGKAESLFLKRCGD